MPDTPNIPSAEELDRLKEHVEALDKSIQPKKQLLEMSIKEAEILQQQLGFLTDEADLRETQIEYEEQLLNVKKRLGTATAEELANHAQRLKNLKAENEEIKKQQQAVEEATKALEAMGDSVGALFKQTSKTGYFDVKKIQNFGKSLKGAGGGMKGLTTFMKSAGIGILINYANAIGNLIIDMANLENEFMKATGASKGMARQVTETYEATRLYGVSAEEASAATQALFTTFTDFTLATVAQQKALAETGAILGELGVGNQEFANSIQISTKAMGMSVEAAAGWSREMTALAMDIGITPAEMAKNFDVARESMAKLGSEGTKAFKQLAIAAKVTGLEMSKILRITDKFDTFEGAAEQVGQLNAALGGNFVNAMDLMMETNPAERFKTIREAISSAGLAFDDMTYYQKKFYTEALGLGDVGDLAMALSGNMDEFAGSTEKTSAELIDMKERAAAVQDIGTQLKSLLADMTPIITPLIDAVRYLVEGLRAMAPVLKVIMPMLAVLGGIFLAMNSPIIAAVAAVTALAAGIGYLHSIMAKEKHSPTFLETLQMTTDMLDQNPQQKVEKTTTAIYKAQSAAKTAEIETLQGATAAGAAIPIAPGPAGGTPSQPVTIRFEVDGKLWKEKTVEIVGGIVRDAGVLGTL